jgi:c-di-AMP phosphodiesterase-like protein
MNVNKRSKKELINKLIEYNMFILLICLIGLLGIWVNDLIVKIFITVLITMFFYIFSYIQFILIPNNLECKGSDSP